MICKVDCTLGSMIKLGIIVQLALWKVRSQVVKNMLVSIITCTFFYNFVSSTSTKLVIRSLWDKNVKVVNPVKFM